MINERDLFIRSSLSGKFFSLSKNFFENLKKFFKNPLTKAICYAILYSQGGERDQFAGYPFPVISLSKTFSESFQNPLDNGGKVCYNKSVNRRGADHLPLKLSLKVCSLSPMILTIFSHRSLSKGLFAHFTSFLWYRVGGAPDYHDGFHSKILSDDGERPVTARKMRLAMWKEYTHISWRDSSMAVEQTLAARN